MLPRMNEILTIYASYCLCFNLQVNPSSTDPVTQQIQSKLGDFQRVRPYLDQSGSGQLIGVDLVPQSPGGPPPSPRHHPLPSSASGSVISR